MSAHDVECAMCGRQLSGYTTPEAWPHWGERDFTRGGARDYFTPGTVPEAVSQGAFTLGATCAKKIKPHPLHEKEA